MVEPKYKWTTAIEWFAKTNTAIFNMFDFLPRQFVLNKMQLLSRDMYHRKVPLLYRSVFLVPKTPVEELFVNMVRNMNPETHKFVTFSKFVMTVVTDVNKTVQIKGYLHGEFLKTNDAPDGRCYFVANDKTLFILCYYKDGKKLKGPQLKFECLGQRDRIESGIEHAEEMRIEIKSKTWNADGHQICTLAVIEEGTQGQTGYFVDKKLVKNVPIVERHSIDWILENFQVQ